MKRVVAIALAVGAGCVDEPAGPGAPIELALPGHFPAPLVPADNPLTAAAVELGRHLFYDARLSVDQTVACSTCHQQRFAFADDRAVSVGATGAPGVLNAPSLANAIYARPLTWAHAGITRIEDQLVGPMFGEAPVEMGMRGAEDRIVDRLRADPVYADLFAAAFADGAIDLDRARFALASFVRSLVSAGSPFDAFVLGDQVALSASARRGADLFYSKRLGCGGCHAGFNLTAATASAAATAPPLTPHHNLGLYDVDGAGGYPARAPGLIAETGVDRDMGRFRVPGLRNVALTAPYMHDGSVASLEDVVAIYEAGGRVITDGPDAGDGRLNPWRSALAPRFTLTDGERADLLAFLRSLSDPSFVADPRHADPW